MLQLFLQGRICSCRADPLLSRPPAPKTFLSFMAQGCPTAGTQYLCCIYSDYFFFLPQTRPCFTSRRAYRNTEPPAGSRRGAGGRWPWHKRGFLLQGGFTPLRPCCWRGRCGSWLSPRPCLSLAAHQTNVKVPWAARWFCRKISSRLLLNGFRPNFLTNNSLFPGRCNRSCNCVPLRQAPGRIRPYVPGGPRVSLSCSTQPPNRFVNYVRSLLRCRE